MLKAFEAKKIENLFTFMKLTGKGRKKRDLRFHLKGGLRKAKGKRLTFENCLEFSIMFWKVMGNGLTRIKNRKWSLFLRDLWLNFDKIWLEKSRSGKNESVFGPFGVKKWTKNCFKLVQVVPLGYLEDQTTLFWGSDLCWRSFGVQEITFEWLWSHEID